MLRDHQRQPEGGGGAEGERDPGADAAPLAGGAQARRGAQPSTLTRTPSLPAERRSTPTPIDAPIAAFQRSFSPGGAAARTVSGTNTASAVRVTTSRKIARASWVVCLSFASCSESEPAPSALGLQFAPGARQALQVRRLAGERIEVCAAAGRCATLERQFDAYDHGI